ncbi:GFA family protein [Pelagibacterium sp.]|uniref:GFA family protein n=1 Tax=Pelagibacterium sp. TaxID=1967288 RepID=UPI003A916FE6
MASRTASCTCGQLSITVEGECLGNGICHCLACQSRTGSVFATLGAWPAPFEVRGEATQFVRTGDAGAQFRFNFCPVCGSTVFHTEEATDDIVMIAIGCLGDPDFPAPQDSVYDIRRHHWVTLPPGTQQSEKNPE